MQSEITYPGFFNEMLEGVKIIDFNLTYLYVNDTAAIHSKKSRHELIGKQMTEVYPGFEKTEIYTKIKKCLAERTVQFDENEFTFEDGRKGWFKVKIIPVPEGAMFFTMEVTDIKSTQEILASSAKLLALGEMACGVAHEINNPLTIVLGTVDMLRKKIERDQIDRNLIQSKLDSTATAAHKIAQIVSGLKTISRNGDNDPLERVDLLKIIEETMPLCQERFRRNGIRINVELNGNKQLFIMARETQLGQVLVNLLNNAIDAVMDLSEKWVILQIENDEKFAKISITDSGNGIPDELLIKIMEPFFTTKPVGKGTGLGLSITKGIIEKFQGKFYYDRTTPNTRFVVELPLI